MDSSIKTGTFSGTLLVLFIYVNPAELLSSIILAAVGAITSFGISVLLKQVFKKKDRK